MFLFFQKLDEKGKEKIMLIEKKIHEDILVLRTKFDDTLVKIKRFQDENYKIFSKEMDQLRAIRHPNIVSFMGYTKYENRICIIMKYISGESLQSGKNI